MTLLTGIRRFEIHCSVGVGSTFLIVYFLILRIRAEPILQPANPPTVRIVISFAGRCAVAVHIGNAFGAQVAGGDNMVSIRRRHNSIDCFKSRRNCWDCLRRFPHFPGSARRASRHAPILWRIRFTEGDDVIFSDMPVTAVNATIGTDCAVVAPSHACSDFVRELPVVRCLLMTACEAMDFLWREAFSHGLADTSYGHDG